MYHSPTICWLIIIFLNLLVKICLPIKIRYTSLCWSYPGIHYFIDINYVSFQLLLLQLGSLDFLFISLVVHINLIILIALLQTISSSKYPNRYAAIRTQDSRCRCAIILIKLGQDLSHEDFSNYFPV